MGKCLVTKLNGSISNIDVMRLGEMRFHLDKVSVPTDGTQGFGIGVNKPVVLEIVGEGYFTDKTLAINKGKTITLNEGKNGVWASNNNLDVAILDKYSITSIESNYPGEPEENIVGTNKVLNSEDLKYCTALNTINLSNTQFSGSIEDLKKLTALTRLYLHNTQVIGDIGDLKSLTSLIYIGMSNINKPLTGNIGAFSNMLNLSNVNLRYSSLSGDLATLPDSCRFASFLNNIGTVFTWGTRPSSANILAIEGNAMITNVDKMLQDQSNCNVAISSSDAAYLKTIAVVGTRTSASDAAVQTLQSKGYTVSITPA